MFARIRPFRYNWSLVALLAVLIGLSAACVNGTDEGGSNTQDYCQQNPENC